MNDNRPILAQGPDATELSEVSEVDPRFSMGLVLDVREVVEAHGLLVSDGAPLLELQLALFQALYRSRGWVGR